MKDVLFGQAYHLRFDPKLWSAMQPYPPLGPLYAAGLLCREGFSVGFADSMLSETTAEWTQSLECHRPRFAVLLEDNFNYLTKMCLLRMRETAFEMISQAKSAGSLVVTGGSDATDHAELYLNAGADYVIIGEGELALAELLKSLMHRSREAPGQIPGVRMKQNDGFVARPVVRDLDSLPFPAWDLVDLPRYREIWLKRHGYFSINMVTTRGCPYGCNWCAKPIWGRQYSSRSPENVVEEIKLLRRAARPDHIWFTDDIFGLKEGWVERFGELMSSHGLSIPFKCLMRTDLITGSVARALKQAGCEIVWLGAESGSQKVLDAMEKGANVEDTRRATALLKEEGIRVAYFVQFGYPGEDWSDIRKTVKMVHENMPHDIGISVSYPLPGTPFHDRVRSEMGAKANWVDSDDLAPLFQGRYPQKFYRSLHRSVHREYRARRAVADLAKGRKPSVRALAESVLIPLDRLRLLYHRRLSSNLIQIKQAS